MRFGLKYKSREGGYDANRPWHRHKRLKDCYDFKSFGVQYDFNPTRDIGRPDSKVDSCANLERSCD